MQSVRQGTVAGVAENKLVAAAGDELVVAAEDGLAAVPGDGLAPLGATRVKFDLVDDRWGWTGACGVELDALAPAG